MFLEINPLNKKIRRKWDAFKNLFIGGHGFGSSYGDGL
jgi:hypothetical protein